MHVFAFFQVHLSTETIHKTKSEKIINLTQFQSETQLQNFYVGIKS
jgi:hypothetical protein